MAFTFAGASRACRWGSTVPEAAAQVPAEQEADGYGISESFARDDPAQCQRVLGFLLDLAATGSLFRVVAACSTLQNPRNGCIDPDTSLLALHPRAHMDRALRRPRPLAD